MNSVNEMNAAPQSEIAALRHRVGELERINADLERQIAQVAVNITPANQACDQECSRCQYAEEQVHHMQRMLQAIVDAMPAAIFWKDRDSVYQGCNRTFARVAGVSAPECIVGKRDDDLAWKREEADYFVQVDRRVMDSDTAEYHIIEPQLQADGKQAWLETNKIPLHDEIGNVVGILGTFEDITEHKQAEEEARIFQTLARNAPDSIAVAGLDGNITYVNPSFRDTMGYGDAIIGMPIAAIVTEEGRERLPSILQQVYEQGSWQGVIDHQRQDGSGFPTQISVGLITTADGTPFGVGAILRDITEQVQRERDLLIFQQMVNSAPDGFGMAPYDGTIVYANEAYRDLTGYGEHLVGMNFLDLFADDDRPLALEGLQETGTSGSWQGTLRFQRVDGNRVLVDSTGFAIRDEHGNPSMLVGMFRDITQQKLQERQIRLAQFTLDRAADSIHWLMPDGMLVYANDTACSMLDYTREELLTMSLFDINPFFGEEQLSFGWQAMKEHGPQTFETFHRHKDGHDIPVEVVASYLEFEGQEYACTFTRDITERKRAEEERTAMQQQIIAAQQSAIRELSTPLIPISENAVVMPLIGTIDSRRAQQVLEVLLEGVAQHQAELAILDITGVQIVDTQVADALIRAAQAVKLLGAQVMLTGIQSQIAQTLVHLGVNLGGIVTQSTLQAGITYALNDRNGARL